MPKMDVTVAGGYFHNVSTTVSGRSYDNLNLNAGLTYRLTKSLDATAQYAYIRQTQTNAFLIQSGNYNANIVGASINYTWNHPLGR